MQALAQTYAVAGARALDKAVNKLNKGRVDMGPWQMPIVFARAKSDGLNQRIDILEKFPLMTPLSNFFVETEEYSYVHIQLDLNEHGVGKGSLTPKCRPAFSPQGQMTLATRAQGPINIVLVHAVK